MAPDTVNTMPMPTLLAAAEKAEIKGATADQDPSETLEALAEAGIDMGDVTKTLLDDGIEKFVEPFDQLIAGVESSKEAAITGRPPTIDSSIPDELEPSLAERVKTAVDEGVARRVWRKDETLWGGPGPEIGDRLGWLTISETMLEHVDDLRALRRRGQGRRLHPRRAAGHGRLEPRPRGDPAQLRQARRRPGAARARLHRPGGRAGARGAVDLDKTLFVVSSKSGGTVETLSHMRYFYERTGGNGKQFVAVTDPGSGLVDLAGERGFRRVFENDPNIGGRYSVLSYFGLVPAALMGVDVEALLQSSREAEENCNSFDDSSKNSGLWMGLAMGELARQGRDKLTFVVSDPVSQLRPLGGAADRGVHRQGGHGNPAGGRRAAGRARRPTATTACSPTSRTRTSPTRTTRPPRTLCATPGQPV